jgi:chromosome segregation ATPase
MTAVEEAVNALKHLPQELAAFRTEANHRFERIDARLDQIDRRLEQVDARFDQIDRRLEQVDARFDQMDGRFSHIDTQFERVYSQMRTLHEDLVDRIKVLGEGRNGSTTAPRARRPKPKR